MKPSGVSHILTRLIPERLPVLLAGAPGIGKTDLVRQAAEACGARLIVSHPVVSDPTDFKGLPGIVDGKAEFLPYGDLRALCSATELTVCLLDDVGQAPPAVQAAAMQWLLARRVNGHAVSDWVTFLAATNRRQDKAGVSGVLEPVKSRFASILTVEADLDDWTSWALSHDVQAEIIAFLRFRPGLLHDFRPTADLTQSPCPRTWAAASRLIGLGIDDPETLTGAVGEGAATELAAFLRIWRQLPSPDAVLLDPAGATVPTDPATLYALCGALAARASDQTGERLIRYANRLPDEFSVLLVRDAVRKDKAVCNSRTFIDWSTRHNEVLS